MKEIIITSSVLILCIMLLRLLFQGKISSRLQYALWLLVALRLMIPVGVQLGDLNELRLMDLVKSAEADTGNIVQRLEEPITLSMGYTGGRVIRFLMPEDTGVPTHSLTEEYDLYSGADGPTSVFIAGRLSVSWLDIFRWIWCGGMLVTALWMLVTNLVFCHRLHRERQAYELSEDAVSFLCKSLPFKICGKLSVAVGIEAGCRKEEGVAEEIRSKEARSKKNSKKGIRLYVIDNLASPCLYGLPGKEAIYLTPDIVSDNHRLCHVLAHELCHKKHGDSIWSLLRSILVTVYWFHPLVWVAAVLSKRDCELACDEAALLILGEEERIPYGETLLSIITRKGKLSDFACTATTMTGSGKSVKERIQLIAKKPKMLGITLAAVLLFVMASIIFCFTKDPRYESGRVLGQSEITVLTEDMQITLPASIGGISGHADEINSKGKRDIIIYQVASGKEVGRFCKRDLNETLQLMDEGRIVVPLGDYGYNYVLWDKLGIVRDRYAPGYTQEFDSKLYSERVTTHNYTYTPTEEENASDGIPAEPDDPMAVSGYEEEETTYLIDDSVDYLPNEQITTTYIPEEALSIDELSGSNCYIYLKADYSKVKDKYLEEMEFINGELEAIAENVIVLGFTQEYRNQVYKNLAEHRTLYIGDNSKVGALIHDLPTPDGIVYSGFSIDTAEKGKYTLRINYDMAAETLNEIDSHMVFFDAVMLFACIGNMDECVIDVEDGSAMWTYYRTELGEEFWFPSLSCDEDLFISEMEFLYNDILKYLNKKE